MTGMCAEVIIRIWLSICLGKSAVSKKAERIAFSLNFSPVDYLPIVGGRLCQFLWLRNVTLKSECVSQCPRRGPDCSFRE